MLRRLPARRRAWGVLRPGRTQQRPWVASTSMVVTLSDAARTATRVRRVPSAESKTCALDGEGRWPGASMRSGGRPVRVNLY